MHTPAYQLFLELLRREREGVGISQRELGRRLKQHHDYASKCESGERQLNIVELGQWCDALEISLPDFIQRLEKAWHPDK